MRSSTLRSRPIGSRRSAGGAAAVLTCGALVGGVLATPAAAAAPMTGGRPALGHDEVRYAHITLLPDTGQGEALGVDNRGDVVGDVLVDDQPHAAIWRDGRLSLIPTGLVRSAAMSVNDEGLVVGQGLDSSGRRHGWAWNGSGSAVLLPSPFAGSANVQVRHVNEAGDIVGTVSDGDGVTHAVVWRGRDESPRALPSLPGSAGSFGSGLSNAGIASGASVSADGGSDIPTVWGSDGTATALPTIGGPADAWAVDDRGLAVGSGFTADGSRSDFLAWWHGDVRDVGVLPGDDDAGPNAINDRGLAVGFSARDLTSGDSGATRAVYWDGGQGLQPLPALPDSTFATAHDVNDAGLIVGLAADGNGDIHPVIWKRCAASGRNATAGS